MPTCNRRVFLEQALRYFDVQDYPNRELVIVEDGDECNIDLVSGRDDIQYAYYPGRHSIGRKRNQACAMAKGDFICLFDDDDIYHPQRLSLQAQSLLDGTADMSACYMSLLLRTRDTMLWHPSEKVHNLLFKHGVRAGTLMYRASYWHDGLRYEDRSRGEDAGYLEGLLERGARLARIERPLLYICVRHHNNVTDEIDGIEPPEWEQAPLERYLSQEQIAFYKTLALREVAV